MMKQENGIIYADVPVAAMSTEELCALPVAGLAAKDCALFSCAMGTRQAESITAALFP